MKKDPWMITACAWIWRIVSANLCWIAFTLLGLGVFGLFPSTVALFTLVRKWIRKDTDAPVWQTFKLVYKKEWKRSNQIGAVFFALALFLFIDIRIAEEIMSGVFASFLLLILYVLSVGLMLAVGYFFAIYVHYDYTNNLQYVKQSLLFTVTSLPSTVFIGLGITMIGYLLVRYPGLIAFISGVAPAYWMMRISMTRFNFLEKRVLQQV